MDPYLPHIFAGILAFSVALYVVLDGFDLGIGILFPFAPGEEARDAMMESVAPVWDGNETWLVMGGVVLFAAFPPAYAVVLPAFYLPLVLMLVALIFRGVAFEFRPHGRGGGRFWAHGFHVGSVVAALAQGIALGGLVEGIAVRDGAYAGGPFDWFGPFPLLCGAALVCGYALLGATWSVMALEGEVQRWARRAALPALGGVLAAIAVVSIWTPLADARIAARWFSVPNVFLLSPVPVVTALAALGLVRSLRSGARNAPFLFAVALFLLSFLGLGISLYPQIVPPSMTVTDAAADPSSLRFLLVGIVAVLPVVLGYTIYSYRVLRRQSGPSAGYGSGAGPDPHA
jgi:cytochrome d ubiquinol oxidase subunit II